MSVTKKAKPIRYTWDDPAVISEEFVWGRKTIKKGTWIRFRGVRGDYKFQRAIRDNELNKTIIECQDQGNRTVYYDAVEIRNARG